MLELVECYKDVIENIKTFNEQFTNEDILIKKLSQFRHWYYIEELDLFGPSKFIGYKGNNTQEYDKGTNKIYKGDGYGYMDGRDTEPILKDWFQVAPENQQEKLFRKLRYILQQFDKEPNKKARIHILKNG